MTAPDQNVPLLTVFICGPSKCEHDYSGWREFRAQHTLQFSRQFLAWSNKQDRDQKSFAEFLEDRVGEVLVPDGAKLYEIATTLQATQQATYSAAIRLSNGDTRFTYTKETKAGNGTLEVPEKITVSIPVWNNGNPQPIDIKLRYRLREDKLTFRLEIERYDDLVDAAIDDAVFAVQKETQLTVYMGSI